MLDEYPSHLPTLRLTIPEAAAALRMSRALLYRRIKSGEIPLQHEGRRSYVTVATLQRYVASRDSQSAA